MKIILVMVVKMWLSFIACTFVEDTEVYFVGDEAYYERYYDMDYNEVIQYELELGNNEYDEEHFGLMCMEYENGDIFNCVVFETDTLDFTAVFDEKYNCIGYGIERY